MTKTIWKPPPVMTEYLQKAPPEHVWHYTNQDGLHGILQSKELWASNARYLNDHQEFALGMNLIRTQIEAMRDKLDNAKDIESRALLENMVIRIRKLRPDTSAYVASWSAADDDLAQWRAYSGGGTGYAISMRGDVLKRLADEQQFTFAECIYDPKDHARWVGEIVETSIKEMLDDRKNGVEYERARRGDKLLFRLLRHAPLLRAFDGDPICSLPANDRQRSDRDY